MVRMVRIFLALGLPLALSSCLLSPGAFTSTVDLRKDGSFAFAYTGEIVFQSPQDLMKMGAKPEDMVWSDDKAVCFNGNTAETTDGAMDAAANSSVTVPPPVAKTNGDIGKGATGNGTPVSGPADNAAAGVDETDTSRACTTAEIAKQKKDWDTEQAAKVSKEKKESAQFGAVFGFTPGDDAANRKLAATIMRYEGWKSVVYKGDGVFDVDYRAAGRLDHDFVFPLLPQSDIVFPFVLIRRQGGDQVRIAAPSLIGGGLRALAARMKALGSMGAGAEMPVSTRTKGSLTVTTDGDIRTNNTEDGPDKVPTGHQLVWQVGPGSERVPEALIRLK